VLRKTLAKTIGIASTDLPVKAMSVSQKVQAAVRLIVIVPAPNVVSVENVSITKNAHQTKTASTAKPVKQVSVPTPPPVAKTMLIVQTTKSAKAENASPNQVVAKAILTVHAVKHAKEANVLVEVQDSVQIPVETMVIVPIVQEEPNVVVWDLFLSVSQTAVPSVPTHAALIQIVKTVLVETPLVFKWAQLESVVPKVVERLAEVPLSVQTASDV